MEPSRMCGGCDAHWTGKRIAHCSGCHHMFSTVAGFDRHRRNGKCLNPAKLRNNNGERVFEKRSNGVWGQAGDFDPAVFKKGAA